MKLKTRLFMTSGGKTYVPDGEPGHHSPFASKFLKALEEGGQKDGYLTFHRILPYVEDAKSAPRYGDFGDPAPGSDFFFEMQVSAVAKGKTFKKDALTKRF